MANLLAPTFADQAAKAPMAATSASPAPASHGITFRELLSDLNPLQHIPIIGTIYRAVTGDNIPETARTIGSLAVSGLMGGPIGILTNLAFLAFEKATGVDPEKIGQEILASLGIKSDSVTAVAASDAPHKPPASSLWTASEPQGSVTPTAWSSSQLLAYGVTTDITGTLQCGGLQGSDVLNAMALAQYTSQASKTDYTGFPDEVPAHAV